MILSIYHNLPETSAACFQRFPENPSLTDHTVTNFVPASLKLLNRDCHIDRRHSDSANMTNFAQQNSEIENVEIAKETEIETKTTECPTYQNTSLMSGIIFYIYTNHLILMSGPCHLDRAWNDEFSVECLF